MEQENLFDDGHQGENQDVHTYFGSVELGSVSDNRKTNKSLITIQIAGIDAQMKADKGAEATVVPYHLSKEIAKKALRKIQQQ